MIILFMRINMGVLRFLLPAHSLYADSMQFANMYPYFQEFVDSMFIVNLIFCAWCCEASVVSLTCNGGVLVSHGQSHRSCNSLADVYMVLDVGLHG